MRMRLVGMVIVLAALFGFLYWAYGMPREAAQSAPSSDMARNPQAAKNYVLEESCRATCTSEQRTCNAAAAVDPDLQERCTTEFDACQKRCEQGTK